MLSPYSLFVLAEKRRYAIENVLLDPLLVACVLARTAEGRSRIGGRSMAQLARADTGELQAVADEVVAATRRQIPSRLVNSEETRSVAYVGGAKLELPAWVLEVRGHDYAAAVLAAFPQLRSHRAGPNQAPEDQLVGAVACNCMVDCVAYAPAELLELFSSIQTAPLAGSS